MDKQKDLKKEINWKDRLFDFGHALWSSEQWWCFDMEQIEEFIETLLQEERKKTLEEVWGVINEKMDTLDINKHEPEINILSWLNKKIDFNITRLSKITKRGK